MANDINSLDPRGFMGIVPKRESAINAASAETPVYDRPANRLARELHPTRQYLTVAEKRREGEDCYTYILVPDPTRGTERLAYFTAGQYISLRVEIGGQIHNRPYSLVSSPREALSGRYAITVKVTEDGFVSRYLAESVEAGVALEASEPMGVFTYEPLRDAAKVVAVAGGSGVTPFISLAKAIADGDEDCSLTLLYGCKTAKDRIFAEELKALSEKCDRIKTAFVISDEDVSGCERGFITAELIRKYVGEGEYSLFVCGPRALHDHIDTVAAELGIDRRLLRHELYGEPACTPGDTVSLTVRQGGIERVISGSTGQTVLRALEWAGIAAPARCRSGECGFCRARLISGEVTIPEESDRRRLADEPHGYIHPCCTYPRTDLVIEVGNDA